MWPILFMLFIMLEKYFVISTEQTSLAVTNGLQGQIVGELTSQAGIFWGIPFSQPPVDQYRWKKPRNPLPFRSKYWNATFARPGCTQTPNRNSLQAPSTTSEDCLYLNVFVPRNILEVSAKHHVTGARIYTIPGKFKRNDADSLAVMVYLHGGNFKEGSGSLLLYDGRFLASRGNVIVVTINYRLGPLGFLVQGTGKSAAVGNYGIWDQLMALKWVKNNIRYFGGNPNKVTLFGQSAGAESIGILMTSQYGRDLFHRAILESDPIGLSFRDWDSAKELGDEFAIKFRCQPGDMKCLRKIPAVEIEKHPVTVLLNLISPKPLSSAAQPWGPVIDGTLLKENPIDSFRKGLFHQIPVIVGGNIDEGYTFINGLFGNRISDITYNLVIEILLKDKASAVLKLYPPECQSIINPNCDNTMEFSDLATDFMFLCPERSLLQSTKKSSWFYIFNATLPFSTVWNNKGCLSRACHGAEIGYVFDPADLTSYHFTKEMYLLARRMEYYWTNFAKYGNPNGNIAIMGGENHENRFQAIPWCQFSTGSKEYNAILFSTDGDKMLTDPYKEKCDLLDDVDLYAKL